MGEGKDECGTNESNEEGRMTEEQMMKLMEEFANLIAAVEREACAQIAHDTYEGFGVDAKGVDFVKERIIAAIRARGQV
jgi:hypothetical protein